MENVKKRQVGLREVPVPVNSRYSTLYRIEFETREGPCSGLCWADSEDDARDTYERMDLPGEPLKVLDVKPEPLNA